VTPPPPPPPPPLPRLQHGAMNLASKKDRKEELMAWVASPGHGPYRWGTAGPGPGMSAAPSY